VGAAESTGGGPRDPAGDDRADSGPGARRSRLYLLGTPVGNLEDLSHRVERLLGEVDLIAAEDTRQTRKLLNHLGLRTRLTTYNQHSPPQRVEEICRRVQAGQNVALVTDAGMPAVSDPGWRLVREAVSRGLEVVPVPGPTALTLALAGSGLPTATFVFDGFLPRRRGPRRRRLAELGRLGVTIVVYESPHRVIDALGDIAEVFGDVKVAVGRELTKVYEEFLRGEVGRVKAELEARREQDGRLRGEFTLVIGVGSRERPAPPDSDPGAQ